jgi:hypothetical protein
MKKGIKSGRGERTVFVEKTYATLGEAFFTTGEKLWNGPRSRTGGESSILRTGSRRIGRRVRAIDLGIMEVCGLRHRCRGRLFQNMSGSTLAITKMNNGVHAMQ